MKAAQLFDISGKVALVTGSAGGLGSSFAEGLAANGATVILNGRNAAKLEQQLEEFRRMAYNAGMAVFDVADSKEIAAAVEDIEKNYGGVDILVNNAGVNLRGPLETFSDEDWDKVLGINLGGTYKVSKAVVPGMIRKKAGKIINLGSMQSELGRPGIAPYAASKGGIRMLTKGMAADWAKYNIQVNAIGPGYFKTDMTRPLYEDPEFDKWLCGRTPSGRWGRPEELLGALLYLASPASDYVNGQMLFVDGGLLSTV